MKEANGKDFRDLVLFRIRELETLWNEAVTSRKKEEIYRLILINQEIPTECLEENCPLFSVHENGYGECAIRVFLLTPFLAWTKEREEAMNSQRELDKKGQGTNPYG